MLHEFKPFAADIYRLEVPFGGDWTGIFLIDGIKKILIDSGSDRTGIDQYLLLALAKRGLKPEDIDYLCCTHTHGDHVGGHARLRQLHRMPVVCGEKSSAKLRDPLLYSRKIRLAFPENAPMPPAVLDGVEPDIILTEGDVLADRLQLIEAPGHDDDCVCWFDLETKTLITGDALQGNGTVIQGIALCMDVASYRQTLRKLARMDLHAIVCGHAYTITGDQASGSADVQTYLARCDLILDIYAEHMNRAVAAGITDLPELASSLIDFMGNRIPEYLFLPLFTVSSLLGRTDERLD